MNWIKAKVSSAGGSLPLEGNICLCYSSCRLSKTEASPVYDVKVLVALFFEGGVYIREGRVQVDCVLSSGSWRER